MYHRWMGLVWGGVLLSVPACHAQANDGPPPTPTQQEDALEVHTVSLPMLSSAEMSEEDAALLNARQADVSKAAAFYGFDISDQSWTYQQIVCRTLPEHLFLAFYDGQSPRGASRFVAIVPHGSSKATDSVQIVTDFSHGLFPFEPAWKRDGSFGIFNRVVVADRGEKPVMPNSHWLNLGMCFVALTGAVPQVAVPVDNVAASEALAKRKGITPIIRVGDHGAAEVAFSDVSANHLTANWKLSFDRDGKLKKVDRNEDGPLKVRTSPLPTAPVEILPE